MLQLDQIQHLHLPAAGEIREMWGLHYSWFLALLFQAETSSRSPQLFDPRQIYPGNWSCRTEQPEDHLRSSKGILSDLIPPWQNKTHIPWKTRRWWGGFLKILGFLGGFQLCFWGFYVCASSIFELCFYIQSILRNLYLFSPFILKNPKISLLKN